MELIWELFRPSQKDMQAMMVGDMMTTWDPTIDVSRHDDDIMYLRQNLVQMTGLQRMLQQKYLRTGGTIDFGAIHGNTATPMSAFMSLMLKLQESAGGAATMHTVRERVQEAERKVEESQAALHHERTSTFSLLRRVSPAERRRLEAEMEAEVARAKATLASATDPTAVTLEGNPAQFIEVSADGVVSGDGLEYLFNAMA